MKQLENVILTIVMTNGKRYVVGGEGYRLDISIRKDIDYYKSCEIPGQYNPNRKGWKYRKGSEHVNIDVFRYDDKRNRYRKAGHIPDVFEHNLYVSNIKSITVTD